jgi:hypothetical protein
MFHGCGGENDSSTYSTTLGTSISVDTTEEGAVMAANTNTVKSISKEVANILKSDITSFNKKMIVAFDKETRYCAISGLKESQNSGTVQKIISTKNYENCQEEKSLQHGKISIDYSQMKEDGKYPKALFLTVKETYSIKRIKLKKDVSVKSSITYNNDKSIKKITLKINGEITMDSIDYGLLNIEHTIEY